MTRVIRLTPRFLRDAARLGAVAGSVRGRAVASTIGALQAEDDLPDIADTRALIPPTREAFVRRVHERNLWVWYTVVDRELRIVALTADPPVPLLP